MRPRTYLMVFLGTFLAVLLLTSSVSSTSVEDIEFKGMVKIIDVEEGYCGAYDGSHYWLVNFDWDANELRILEISLSDGHVISNNTINAEFYGYPIDAVYFDGYIWVLSSYYNETIEREAYLMYKINPSNWDAEFKLIDYPEGYEVLSLNVYDEKIFAILSDFETVIIRELNYNEGNFTETDITFEFVRSTWHTYLTYFGDEFLAYAAGQLYDNENNTLINVTGDIPYNVSWYEVYNLDNSYDAKKLAILLFMEYYENSKKNYGLFIMLYQIKEKGGGLPGADIGEASPTEPVGASSVVVATASAITATASVAAVATAAATTTATTTTTVAAAGTGAGAAAAGVVPLPSREGGLGNLWKYGLKAGKALSKLLRRKKKDEEKFSKPSYLKTMIYLAIISAVISIAISIVKPSLLAEVLAILSVAFIGIGLGFGVFGSIIGFLLYSAIRNNLLPPTTRFGMLGLIGSIIGGVYGVITSIIKFLAVIGLVSIIGIIIIAGIGFVFAMAAYSFTLGLYE